MTKSHPEGSLAEPPPAFLVPELLEAILLQIDMHTLLVSCQRVCRLWRDVINDSSNLQEALFFKPAKQSEARQSETADIERMPNTLLTDIVWPQYMRSNIQSDQHRWPGKWSRNLPTLNREREEAFTRPEASWRRMALHQPPDFQYVGHARKKNSTQVHYCTITGAGPRRQPDSARMDDITRLIQRGQLIPCKTPWTFALTKSFEKVHDVAKLDELWKRGLDGSSANNFARHFIIGLVWIPSCDVPMSDTDLTESE